jgi:transposase
MSNGQIEIINGHERRRRWSLDDKLRIVAESREPGSSVRAVAARYDVYPNLLSTWRSLESRGRLATASPARFVPVRVVETVSPPAAIPASTSVAADAIEITLPNGSRVRVGNDVSLAALRRVMSVLRG